MIQQFRNLRVAAATVVERLTDDPALLAVQASQRLPRTLSSGLASMSVRVFPSTSSSPVPVMGSLVLGDMADVERRVQLASSRLTRAGRARLLADIALVGNRPDLSDRLATQAEGSPRYAAFAARRRWFDGDMAGAVAVLQDAANAQGQLRRLQSELDVFRGLRPHLPSIGFTPRRDTVLHVLTNSLPHTESGYAQRTHSILMAQAAAGWNVKAVTRLGYPVHVGKVLARGQDVVDGISYGRLLPGVLRAGMAGRLQQQAEQLLDVALKVRPSVLHTTTHFANGLVTAAVAEAIGIPWVYEVRGQLADTWAATRSPAALGSDLYRLFQEREGEVMRRADLVVTLGEQMKQSIVRHGVEPSKVLVCPNAVGGEFLDEPVSPAAARAELGLPIDGQWVGTVSSLVHYEGLETLLETAALLTSDYPGLRVLLVGSGVAAASLQKRANDLGLGDRVVFTGRVPREKARLYHQALDVFVVPRADQQVTRHVTPLKPVEAMACARPVLASRLPALAEIVDDGRSGLLADAGDARDFAIKLKRLLDSAELRSRLGKAGRGDVLKNRTWMANVNVLASAYDRLTKDRE
ncbi:glycosyltransferase family 4 protein [Micrococcaceae bacterium Sec5.7]